MKMACFIQNCVQSVSNPDISLRYQELLVGSVCGHLLATTGENKIIRHAQKDFVSHLKDHVKLDALSW